MRKIVGPIDKSTTQGYLPGLDIEEPGFEAFMDKVRSIFAVERPATSSTFKRERPASGTVPDADVSEINQRRLQYLETQVTPLFLANLKEEDDEFGLYSETEQILRRQLRVERVTTLFWLNKLWVRNFSNKQVMIGLLRLLERFDEDELYPVGQGMAMGALNHKSVEVQELVIRAFENWVSAENLANLKSLQPSSSWLKKYLDRVIVSLEQQLCRS